MTAGSYLAPNVIEAAASQAPPFPLSDDQVEAWKRTRLVILPVPAPERPGRDTNSLPVVAFTITDMMTKRPTS